MQIANLRQHIIAALQWSERYMKTDMIYLARGGFWLSLGHGAAAISSLLLTIAFANLVSAEIYGAYRYVLSIIGILSIATFPGINSVTITAVAKGNEQSFLPLLKKKIVWSLASLIAGLTISGYYFLRGNDILSLCFLIVSIGVPLMSSSGLYASLLVGRKDFKKMARWTTGARISVTASMILALFFTNSIVIFTAIYFIPEILINCLALFYISRAMRSDAGGIESTSELAAYGFHLSIMEVLKTIASQIDKILIFQFIGAAELAIYTIATAAPGQIKGLMQHATTLALPKLSISDPESVRVTLPQKLLRLEVLVILVIMLYCVAAPFLFLVFLPQYSEALIYSQVYALSLIFFPRTFLSTAMLAHMRTKEMYGIRIWAPILRMAIFIVVLPFWGLWGMIVGSIVGNALTAMIYHHYFKKAFPVK